MKKIVYHLHRKRCPKCKKLISTKPPGVLAGCLYSNQLLASVAIQHYIYGNTLGQVEKQTGIGYGNPLTKTMIHTTGFPVYVLKFLLHLCWPV
jgi:hypothetical protein